MVMWSKMLRFQPTAAFRESRLTCRSRNRAGSPCESTYPSSHTNPIFVSVGGKPVRASKKSAELCLKSVDQCWTKKEPAIRVNEKEEARKAYEIARDAYKR